jgi:hypothetical protein
MPEAHVNRAEFAAPEASGATPALPQPSAEKRRGRRLSAGDRATSTSDLRRDQKRQ